MHLALIRDVLSSQMNTGLNTTRVAALGSSEGPVMTLTLTSIDMMLESSPDSGIVAAQCFFFFSLSLTAETPSSYLTRVLGFSTTPVFFSNSLPLFSFFFFLSLFCVKGPLPFFIWELEISPIDPRPKAPGPRVCF